MPNVDMKYCAAQLKNIWSGIHFRTWLATSLLAAAFTLAGYAASKAIVNESRNEGLKETVQRIERKVDRLLSEMRRPNWRAPK